MAFDGREHMDPDLGFPVLAHPEAALTGSTLATPLRQAYVVARHRSRRVLDQHFELDLRQPGVHPIAETTRVRLAEAYRWLPPETTHLVGEYICRVLNPDQHALLNGRLVVTDGVHTSTGVVATRTISGQTSVVQGPYSRIDDPVWSPFGQSNEFRLGFEVALGSVAAGGTVLVYFEANATRGLANVGASMIPLHVGVWTEIR